jgi:hypothetical protein
MSSKPVKDWAAMSREAFTEVVRQDLGSSATDDAVAFVVSRLYDSGAMKRWAAQ